MVRRHIGDKPLLEPMMTQLTHWGRVTHICVNKLTVIGSDDGLSPGRRQAIIWANVGILLIGPLGTNFSENSIEILTFSFTKMRLKVSSAKWRPFCLGLNVLIDAYMCVTRPQCVKINAYRSVEIVACWTSSGSESWPMLHYMSFRKFKENLCSLILFQKMLECSLVLVQGLSAYRRNLYNKYSGVHIVAPSECLNLSKPVHRNLFIVFTVFLYQYSLS